MVHRKYKYLHDIEYTSIGADMRIINNLNVLFDKQTHISLAAPLTKLSKISHT